MKTNYFYLLLLLFALLGCSDEKIPSEQATTTEDIYVGVHDEISFTKETESFNYGNLIFHIKTPDGNIIQRKAKHRRLSGTSLFKMETGLKEGKYQLLYIEYTIQSDCPDIDGRKGEFGMGCYITVGGNGITAESDRNDLIDLYGSGTPEDPYRITSADDLVKIQNAILNYHNNGNLVNSSTCFEQQNDINMNNYIDKCGWEGNWYQIGLSSSYPFTGCYNGNGYTIHNMKMLDENAVGASLFGYVNQAVIENITIEDAEITGYGALSAVVGAVITKGGNFDNTYIKGCTVKKSTIKSRSNGVVTDGMALGGIAGMADPNVNLWIDSCSVEDCNINGAIAVGGILGGGTTYSKTQITNSHNRRTSITASYNCAGGIVGYADTLYVYSCTNDGTIKGAASTTPPPGNLSSNSVYNVGTGGIVGGSGLSTIISSRNSGTVHGDRGVGGIIGSTLVTTDPESYYNNTFIGFCSNSGSVDGNNYIGGLCGESQIGTYKSYNEGSVNAHSSYAGGIVGFSPLSSITNTVNFATVYADSYSGGIAGFIISGSFGINTNLGGVKAKNECAGGMIGRAGNTLSMNYCSNFGYIDGYSFLGGLIGEAGDSKKLTIKEKVSLVFEAGSVIVGFIPFGEYVGKTGEIMINSSIKILGAVLNDIDKLTELFYKPGGSSENPVVIKTDGLKGFIANDIATLESDMDTKLATKINDLKLLPFPKVRNKDMIKSFMSNRKDLIQWYETGTNHQTYSDAMNYKRDLIHKQILKHKKRTEVVHKVIGGVCLVTNTAVLIAGIVTFPESIPVVATLGEISAVVGFINSVTATLDDFTDNSVVITQCLNSGSISYYNNGGIIGELGSNALISDCVNAGRSNGEANAIVGNSNQHTKAYDNLNVGANWFYFGSSGDYSGNHYMLGTIKQHHSMASYILTLNKLKSKESYYGWDFDIKWEIPSDELGSFPIPKKSEMQFEKPSL